MRFTRVKLCIPLRNTPEQPMTLAFAELHPRDDRFNRGGTGHRPRKRLRRQRATARQARTGRGVHSMCFG